MMKPPARSASEHATARPIPDVAVAQQSARLREQVLAALARNRVPGYHFPGHFLDLRCVGFEREGVALTLPEQRYAIDPDGNMNLHATALLADMTLAACNRIFVPPTVRTATLELHMAFTGVPARGELRCEARSEGFLPHTLLQQAYCRGRVECADGVVAQLSGTWVAPPIPAGRKLAPLPWEQEVASAPVAALSEDELDASERGVLRRAEASLAATLDRGGFLRHFWSGEAHPTPTGSRATFRIGMHTGNRVGHVQGGLLVGFAGSAAAVAVPRHPFLTSISAWFISPGEGRTLSARSQILQNGRNVAVVRTQVFGARRKRVMEVITSHAVRAHATSAFERLG